MTDLKEFTEFFNEIAPLQLAESWDNVGLLVEPSPPHNVTNVMLVEDLTVPVISEAILKKIDLIYSYHPPIFRPLTSLTQSSVKEKIIIKAIENRVAIYSPHTAMDAARHGITDWLAGALGKWTQLGPIIESDKLKESDSAGTVGSGRRGRLCVPALLEEIVQRVKDYLKLKHITVAVGEGKTMGSLVSTGAVVCGSGAGVLKGLEGVDIFLTGEMSHHDVLDSVARGTSVILCSHGNSERGFLGQLKSDFEKRFGDTINVYLSEEDVEPLQIV